MKSLPTASVIIPTYNRKNLLRDTLRSLAQQTLPFDLFDVIVVDDGSNDGTYQIGYDTFPFQLTFLRQTNQGDAVARNLGASHSCNDVLVFLDDDMLVEMNFLINLLREHTAGSDRIVIGNEKRWVDKTLRKGRANGSVNGFHDLVRRDSPEFVSIPFCEITRKNFSIRKEHYLSLGMMRGLDFPGSSIWCDVDLSYRAYLKGFEFYQSIGAICWHRDTVVRSLDDQCARMFEAAYRAVCLLQKYPDLGPLIPMLRDKLPIQWTSDPAKLILQKLLRQIASARPSFWVSVRIYHVLNDIGLPPVILNPIHQVIIGGSLFRGYRAGLKDLT